MYRVCLGLARYTDPISLICSLSSIYHLNLQMFMTDVIPEVAPRMFALGCSNLRVHVRTHVHADRQTLT